MTKTDDGFCCSFNTISIEESFVNIGAVDDQKENNVQNENNIENNVNINEVGRRRKKEVNNKDGKNDVNAEDNTNQNNTEINSNNDSKSNDGTNDNDTEGSNSKNHEKDDEDSPKWEVIFF